MAREKTLLGKNIIYLCKKRGISRKELANQVGITEVSLSRYIYGTRNPKFQTVYNIADRLGTTIRELTEENIEELDNNSEDELEKTIDKYFDLVYWNVKEISENMTKEQKIELIKLLL